MLVRSSDYFVVFVRTARLDYAGNTGPGGIFNVSLAKTEFLF
jgi:hypothetical protein